MWIIIVVSVHLGITQCCHCQLTFLDILHVTTKTSPLLSLFLGVKFHHHNVVFWFCDVPCRKLIINVRYISFVRYKLDYITIGRIMRVAKTTIVSEGKGKMVFTRNGRKEEKEEAKHVNAETNNFGCHFEIWRTRM